MKSVLNNAVQNGDIETVRNLVSNGLNIKDYEDDVVHYTASYGHLELIKYLVSVGIDFRSDNDYAVN
jgi:ankyrin repeat protein